jgi:TPR repeat protein
MRRIKLWSLFLVAVVASSILGQHFFGIDSHSETVAQSIHGSSLASAVGPTSSNKTAVSPDKECVPPSGQPLISVTLRSALSPSPELDLLHEQAFRTPQDVRQKAIAGDALAAVAYFRVAMTCAPAHSVAAGTRPPEGCPIGIKRSEAFSLLEQAAVTGSKNGKLEAQTVFALNAATYAASLQQEGTNEALANSARLRKRSEEIGEAAAKAGSEEAMMFLARAYLTGQFGARDNERGYMYLLPLSRQAGSQAVTDLLQSVSKSLTPSARANAEIAAFGCSGAGSTVVSPFSTQNPKAPHD